MLIHHIRDAGSNHLPVHSAEFTLRFIDIKDIMVVSGMLLAAPGDWSSQ